MTAGSGAVALRRPMRRSLQQEILEAALVVAIGIAAIAVLVAIRDVPEVTPATKVASIQASADETALGWRTYKELQISMVGAPSSVSSVPVIASFESPGSDAGALEWRAFKESSAGLSLAGPAPDISFESPGSDAGALGWRAYKEMAASTA